MPTNLIGSGRIFLSGPSGRRMPDGQKKYLGLSHLRQLFTVRPHCPWLNIRFIVSIFTHNLLFVVANLLFLHLKPACRQSRCKSKVCNQKVKESPSSGGGYLTLGFLCLRSLRFLKFKCLSRNTSPKVLRLLLSLLVKCTCQPPAKCGYDLLYCTMQKTYRTIHLRSYRLYD